MAGEEARREMDEARREAEEAARDQRGNNWSATGERHDMEERYCSWISIL